MAHSCTALEEKPRVCHTWSAALLCLVWFRAQSGQTQGTEVMTAPEGARLGNKIVLNLHWPLVLGQGPIHTGLKGILAASADSKASVHFFVCRRQHGTSPGHPQCSRSAAYFYVESRNILLGGRPQGAVSSELPWERRTVISFSACHGSAAPNGGVQGSGTCQHLRFPTETSFLWAPVAKRQHT